MDIPPAALASIEASLAPISRQVWDARYRLKAADGTPIDAAMEDTWRRIARALSSPEPEPAVWEERFHEESHTSMS